MNENLRALVTRGSAVNVMVSLGLRSGLFVQSVVYARVFAPAELGQIATVLLIFSFTTLITQMGFREAIIREDKSPRALMNTAFTLALGIGLVLFIGIFLGAPVLATLFNRSELAAYIRFMAFMVFSSALALPNVLWIRQFEFGISRAGACVDVGLSTTVTLLTYFITNAAISSLLVGRLAGFIGNYTTVWALLPYRPRLEFDRRYVLALCFFGWPLVVHSLCNYLINHGDSILVRYFWGDESLAYYTLAFALPFYLKDFADMLLSSLLPAYSQIRDSTDKTVAAFRDTNRYLSAAIVPCGMSLVLLADPLIRVVFGEMWAPAILPLRLLGLAFTINLMGGYSWGVLVLASGKTKQLMYLNLWSVFYLGTVGAYLISKYGLIGAASYAVSAAFITDGLIRNFILYRHLGSLSFLRDTARSLLAGALPAVFIAMFIGQVSGTLALLLAAGAYFIAYTVLLVVLDKTIIDDLKCMYRTILGSPPVLSSLNSRS
jgi:O-antigen/teichoic acid export membrane protein